MLQLSGFSVTPFGGAFYMKFLDFRKMSSVFDAQEAGSLSSSSRTCPWQVVTVKNRLQE